VNDLIIDEKKRLAIELLADGELTKTEISKRCGVSRQALYEWTINEEFIAALDERLHSRKKFVEKRFDVKLEFVIDKLYELASDSSNKRVQAQVLQYLADRSLGRIPAKHELTTKIDTGGNNFAENEIKDVFDMIEDEND
jgi:predicted DNA-binding protein YlxM (UPF0122 family)